MMYVFHLDDHRAPLRKRIVVECTSDAHAASTAWRLLRGSSHHWKIDIQDAKGRLVGRFP
jgi:hypothetical protein